MLLHKIKISIFLMLILINGNAEVSACPSASIVHGWSCVDDAECPNWQYCDLWDHLCRTREGYCGYDLLCKNPWEECTNETHECLPAKGYCANDSGCEEGLKCITHKCAFNDDNSTGNNDANNTNDSGNLFKDYFSEETMPLIAAAVIILIGIIISFYINKKFS